MKIKLLMIALFLTNIYHAQKIYLSKNELNDSLVLEKKISDIAAKISNYYKDAKSLDSLEKLFKLEMLATHFKQSISTIRKYKQTLANESSASIKFANFEIYALARDIELNEKIPFSQALDKAFNNKYSEFPDKYSFRFADILEEDVSDSKEKIKKALESIKEDSIDSKSVVNLCINYLDYKTISKTQATVRKLLALKDKNKYIVESIELMTKKGGTVNITITRKIGNQRALPVILTNNIYAGTYDNALGKRAAAYDYIGAVVNTRGKRNSPDAIEPFEHESEDLYDVIDWISKQSWCNGKVGMIGGSYLGFSQWAATKKLHPALKTIVPQVSVGIGIDYPMNNNVFMSYMLQWITYVTNNKLTDEADFKNYNKWDSINTAWYKSGKSFRALDSIAGKSNEIFQRWLDHPSYDAYWKAMIPYKKDFSKINIPVLSTTGFYDADQLGAMYYFREFYKYNKNPNHYIVIGPYDHGGAQSYATNILRGYQLDKVAKINISDLAFSWFDYILKNGSKPELLKDKVNVQIMDTDKWYHSPTLEKTHDDKLKLYLAKESDSRLILTKEKSEKKDFVKQIIDFKDRNDKAVYHKFGKDSLYVNNSVIYETEIFDKDVIINGSFITKLSTAINKKDIDITISLYQIKPGGGFFFLSDYLGRASYAKNREKRHLLKPGKIETIYLTNSTFVGKKIPKGSKLVVRLGINKNSYNQINYGTGKDVSDETIKDAGEPLEVKWYNDSYIEIPIIKN